MGTELTKGERAQIAEILSRRANWPYGSCGEYMEQGK